jgi:hypothetical protein
LTLGEYPTIKNKAVYATMQPPVPPTPDPPSASIGVEGGGSDTGTLEVVVKSEAKKSIVVDEYAVRELRDATKLSEDERLVHALLYTLQVLSRVASEWRWVRPPHSFLFNQPPASLPIGFIEVSCPLSSASVTDMRRRRVTLVVMRA